ncbi:hypothetical protein NLU13_3790 [Sarocladium strictum]|uniref:Ysc84 actin-binding domain-containing protein n=1 Tax=Sarocladium strictum TaxID=5046 RepID=A0AA39L8C4_SARSR|nr:hypothetical protein NLU13_3790 [Sarocladium strictum]
MQKVKERAPGAWASTKTHSKKGFDKAWGLLDKLGAPINRLSNKIGSEAFWPTTLDRESDKAARILRSFCKDGFYAEPAQSDEKLAEETANGGEKAAVADGVPRGKQRVIKKIPQRVIENAVGLAIFTTMRTGLWLSGAGGSGVLVARKEDGTWSPPSGIMLHTAGLGFLVGVDIYDCVVVINSRKALEAFTAVRATLGGEISAVAGPVGVGGVLENDGKWKQANRPVFTYLKSRGFYAGVQVDGTIVIERSDENARFYDQPGIRVADILAGGVRRPPASLRMLMETLKAAEGRTDVDSELLDELDELPPPGDVEVEAPSNGKIFGIPEEHDPDPYGVHALEAVGLEIHEAGTGSRPSSEVFSYNPSPSSPVFGIRSSMDQERLRGFRLSLLSDNGSRSRSGSNGRPYSSSDAATQTNPGTWTESPEQPQPPPPHLSEGSSSHDAHETIPQVPDLDSQATSPDSSPNVDPPEKTERNVWEDAREDLSPTPRPKAIPPPLPPRQSLQAGEAGFEDVELHGLNHHE